MTAFVKILVQGYTNADSVAETGEEKTCPTVTLVRDGDLIMVVDPGVLPDKQILIDALDLEGLNVQDVNMVCITHSHIDHYRNLGMFPDAKVLEYFGVWQDDTVEEWQENLTEHIQILRTPGHDHTSITILVTTADNGTIAVCGDVFWKENYPEEDIYATDSEMLRESRDFVLKIADWIIPGHGSMYKSPGVSEVVKQKVKAAIKSGGLKVSVCKKCHNMIKRPQERCLCQPTLCFRCCECDIDCDLCSCKHKRR